MAERHSASAKDYSVTNLDSLIGRKSVLSADDVGAARWQTIVRVVVPAAGPGVAAGIALGLGRAVGETMIVLMASGNAAILSASSA